MDRGSERMTAFVDLVAQAVNRMGKRKRNGFMVLKVENAGS